MTDAIRNRQERCKLIQSITFQHTAIMGVFERVGKKSGHDSKWTEQKKAYSFAMIIDTIIHNSNKQEKLSKMNNGTLDREIDAKNNNNRRRKQQERMKSMHS